MVRSASSSFQQYAQQLRRTVDDALDRYTRYGQHCPAALSDAIRHSLLAPAKRLRPLLVLMSAEACGCELQQAMPAACAIEMVHTYSLIHDDLPAMDDDDLRRGRPTCHVKFGQATAILAGDALLTQAFAVLAAANWPAEVATRAVAQLAAAAGAAGMVGGQVDDLAAEKTGGDLTTLESIHRRKTGAMIRASLRLGAIVASADARHTEALDQYGGHIGLAFQIVDDLLDLQGNEQSLGKRAGKDNQRGKLTFPGLLGPEQAAARAEQLVDEACKALNIFGSGAGSLEALARFILERKH